MAYHDCLTEMRRDREAGLRPRPETVATAVDQVKRLGERAPRYADQLLHTDLTRGGVPYEEARRLAAVVGGSHVGRSEKDGRCKAAKGAGRVPG